MRAIHDDRTTSTHPVASVIISPSRFRHISAAAACSSTQGPAPSARSIGLSVGSSSSSHAGRAIPDENKSHVGVSPPIRLTAAPSFSGHLHCKPCSARPYSTSYRLRHEQEANPGRLSGVWPLTTLLESPVAVGIILGGAQPCFWLYWIIGRK